MAVYASKDFPITFKLEVTLNDKMAINSSATMLATEINVFINVMSQKDMQCNMVDLKDLL